MVVIIYSIIISEFRKIRTYEQPKENCVN